LGRLGHRARPGRQAHPGHPGLKDTSFKKFNLNLFYKKNGFWILSSIQIFGLDLNLDPNIWIWILKKSKLLLLKKWIWV